MLLLLLLRVHYHYYYCYHSHHHRYYDYQNFLSSMRQTEFDYVLAFWSEQTLKRFLFDLSWISSLLVAILELGSVDFKLCCVWSFFRHLVSICTFFTVYSLRCSCLSFCLTHFRLFDCVYIYLRVRSFACSSVCVFDHFCSELR